MRRSICSCEPISAFAGHVTNWKFSYTTASPLPKGTRLKFDLQSKGREIDWQIPSINLKEKKNGIWAQLPDGKVCTAREVLSSPDYAPAFEFSLPTELKVGETIDFFLGSPDSNKEKETHGNRAQSFVQRRKAIHLYIDPKGKGDYKDPEIFTIDIKGNQLDHIRITAPSLVAKNKRFDVSIRFEDRFGNLTGLAKEGTLIEVSYENLRENLSWKLFIPETGFLNIPNLYFNEPGFYRVKLRNLTTGDCYFSAPIQCFSEITNSLFWGLLHGESEKFDSLEQIESCLRYFRDEKNLAFYATSTSESAEETSNEAWKGIQMQVAEFNEDLRFSALLGMQWHNELPEEGMREIIYAKEGKPLLRKKDAKTSALKKIYKGMAPKELISIPCFTMGKGVGCNFEDFDPDVERVVEIYNAWGSSECLAKEGNLFPIMATGKKGCVEWEAGSIRKALGRNLRFGFVAGGLDDRGIYQDFFSGDQVQYSPGLTAILAPEHTRESLFQALTQRSCYATTGVRIVLNFSIAGAQMGSELSTRFKPGLLLNRHITGFVGGTAPIKEIMFIRNGTPFHSIYPKSIYSEFAIDDEEPLSKLFLPGGPGEKPPFVYYYIRVLQEDGHVAWSSPIWIDQIEGGAAPNSPTKKQKKG